MNPERLLSRSLRALPQGMAIARILAAALAAVEPAEAVQRYLRREDTLLRVGGAEYDLAAIKRVFVVGAGKAGAPMARAAAAVLGERLSGGCVVVKEGYAGQASDAPSSVLLVREAAHPVPDARGVAATNDMLALLNQTTEHDLVIALISGGGSALLTRPVDGVTLADMQELTGLLLGSGATIGEINTLRKHLDMVKGGGLARAAAPAHLVALILSDVVGSPLDVIASGPTVADPTTFDDALAILERYSLLEAVPPAVRAYLEHGAAGTIEDTVKSGDPRLARVVNVVVGSNAQAAQAAAEQAAQEGFQPLVLTTFLQGEAREVGHVMAAIGRELGLENRPIPRPACVIAGGETTVTLRGNGLGGRNQELALAAITDLAGLPDVVLATLATDGGDGPTDAAGAIVSGASLQHARALGLDPTDFLARNDAYRFFAPLGDLLLPGPTQTNVNDLTFVFSL